MSIGDGMALFIPFQGLFFFCAGEGGSDIVRLLKTV